MGLDIVHGVEHRRGGNLCHMACDALAEAEPRALEIERLWEMDEDWVVAVLEAYVLEIESNALVAPGEPGGLDKFLSVELIAARTNDHAALGREVGN